MKCAVCSKTIFRGMDTLVRILVICAMKDKFYYFLFAFQTTFEKPSDLQKKNLLPRELILFS